MFAKIVNGVAVQFPYTDDDIRRDNPGTSFPSEITNEIRQAYGVLPVVVTGQPVYDAQTQAVKSAGCVYNNQLQRWETAWQVRNLTQEEIQARVPNAVTMRQGRLALLQFGLLSLVDASISLMPDPMQREAAKIEWEYATEIVRNSPLVQGLTGALGLTEEALDQLFTLAATL